jgi:signal transduction histidine kinase
MLDTKNYNVLYVDDELHNLNSFKAAFRRHYNVFTALGAKEGIEILNQNPIHLIITDQRMPEMTGVEFLEKAIGLYPETIRMILTGFSDVEDIIRAINTGRIYRYITKPWQEQELKMTIDLALESLDLRIRNTELQKEAVNNELAIHSAKFKDQFLANMSHEIRTPMNAIVGMTKLMLKMDQGEDNMKYLSAIQQASGNLLVIVNDILDVSKIEAGKMEIEQIPFSLINVVEGVQNTLQFKAEEKNLPFFVVIDKDIPTTIVGDPTRLTQVLINLIGNAIKFTESGSVTLKVHSFNNKNEGEPEPHNYIQFEIIDTGIGIAEDKIEKVFESFSQAGSDTSRKFGGTGLGLTISKQLSEMMGGKIGAISELGQGTTFWFTIPSKIAEESSIIANEATHDYLDLAKQLNGINILLTEDDGFNQIVAIDTLESLIPNVKIEVAENGKIATEKVASSKYDIVLMDLQMPEMNGYIATETIRATGNSIKIMAMTADALKTDTDRCFAIGMNDYISKPFEEEDLIRKIFKHVKAGLS